ncbi:MAG: hypothetical protein RLZZ598_922, partial [Pseudomonadota bacterium]
HPVSSAALTIPTWDDYVDRFIDIILRSPCKR